MGKLQRIDTFQAENVYRMRIIKVNIWKSSDAYPGTGYEGIVRDVRKASNCQDSMNLWCREDWFERITRDRQRCGCRGLWITRISGNTRRSNGAGDDQGRAPVVIHSAQAT